MKNVRDILLERGLYFVIGDDALPPRNSADVRSKAVVIVYLYYKETVAYYLRHLEELPCDVAVCVITSNPTVYQTVDSWRGGESHRKIILRSKENRGRDVAALLVTSADLFQEYEYVCFLHDKKPKKDFLEEEVNGWAGRMCEDLIGSGTYVDTVLSLFEDSTELGLLVPPEPVGKWQYLNGWTVNYRNTKELAVRLGIRADIDENKPPLALGTMFWCRTRALESIFAIQWKPRDFLEEPLPADGTVSHAIERIFPYAAQSAGYSTGIVEKLENAGKRLAFLAGNRYRADAILKEYTGIELYAQMEDYDSRRHRLLGFCHQHKQIYIYGAGMWGRDCLQFLRQHRVKPAGFAVTGKPEISEIEGIPVYGIGKTLGHITRSFNG